MKRYYVGPKQATIENSNFFDASITLVGDSTNGNVAYCPDLVFEYWNPDNNFKEEEIYNLEIAKITEEAEIMPHSPHLASNLRLPKNVKLICMNELKLLEILDNKIQTRALVEDLVPTLHYTNILGSEFNYEELSKESKELVVQLPVGSGGSKTFFCNELNHEQVKRRLIGYETYSVSAYKRENTPYNIHCLIGDNQIEILPPSEQMLEIIDKIEYYDSTYEIELTEEVKTKFITYCTAICERLQSMGYRGVLGMDFIYTEGELYFIEINPRFQGSTKKMDKLLKESNLPSIFEYNYAFFNHQEMPSTKDMIFSIF